MKESNEEIGIDPTKGWFKKHADSAIVLGTILTALFWFHGRIDKKFEKIDERLAKVETEITVMKVDMTIMKTVLIMQDIMPKKLATQREKESNDN